MGTALASFAAKLSRKRRRALPAAAVFGLLLLAALAGRETPAAASALAAAATTPPAYRLPWKAGQRIYVLQGHDQGSHIGPSSLYAYDFAAGPFDRSSFQVAAARAGRVAKIVQSFPDSPDCDASYNPQTNYVALDHGDGTGARYMHLARDSVVPRLGAWVAQGEPLARTGHSGWVCGPPHLHFTVMDMATWISRDAAFSDRDILRDGGRPRTGQWYVSDNGPRTYSVGVPLIPRRAGPWPR